MLTEDISASATIYGAASGEAGAKAIVNKPLSYVRGGYVNISNGQSRLVGGYGYGWSRVSRSRTNGYLLYMNTTNVGPSGGNGSYRGFPLRCRTISQEKYL